MIARKIWFYSYKAISYQKQFVVVASKQARNAETHKAK
jgi:hypothetical protein